MSGAQEDIGAQLANPDAAILKACAAFDEAYQAELTARAGGRDLPLHLVEATWATVEAVKAFSPVTLEGVRAKARVGYVMAFKRAYPAGSTDWREDFPDLGVAVDILADLAGARGWRG